MLPTGYTDSWMTCLGLSKLKPSEKKPIHCQFNNQQKCRMRNYSLGQELPWEGQRRAQEMFDRGQHMRRILAAAHLQAGWFNTMVLI